MDFILTAIRHYKGIDLEALKTRGFGIKEAVIRKLISEKLIAFEDKNIRLQKKGYFLVDRITSILTQEIYPLTIDQQV